MNKHWLILAGFVCIFTLSFLLFRATLEGYFFQDDWFTLSLSQVQSLKDFLGFFVPRSDVIYYRPLGMQVYFFTMQSLFGLDARPFHISAFIAHFLAIFLVWKMTRILTGNPQSALLTSFFYGTASIHFILFYWPSTFPFLLGVVWYLLSAISYFQYRTQNQPWWLVSSFGCFLFGLVTNELLITLPLQLIVYDILISKKKSISFEHGLFLAALIPYGLLRFRLGAVPLSESYTPSISSLLGTLRTYFLWALNWPEEIRNQFVGPLTINPDFLKDFPFLSKLLITSSITILFIWVLSSALLWQLRSSHPEFKYQHIMLFGISWFSIALLPLLFFPSHTFPYYLVVPTIGLFISWSSSLTHLLLSTQAKSQSTGFLIILIMIISWFASAWVSVEFSTLTHWASKRARITRILLSEIKNKYPTLPPSARLFLPRDNLLRITLNDQLALRLLYQNNGIQTFYSEGKDEEREKFVPKNDTELIERYPFRVEFVDY